MTTQELLLVLVHEILNDQETADVVDQSIIHRRVELDGIRILAIVANRVIHLDQSSLSLGNSWLFHCGDVTGRLIALVCPKYA